MEDEGSEMGDRALGSGLVLIIAGLALLFMGTDLATGGHLTRWISRGGAAVTGVAAALPPQAGPRDVAA